MTDPARYLQVFHPFRHRIRGVVTLILDGEGARARKEGIPDTVFAEGTLNTLLGIVARVACAIVFPGDDPDKAGGRDRVARVQAAALQAMMTIMAQEKDGASGPRRTSDPTDKRDTPRNITAPV